VRSQEGIHDDPVRDDAEVVAEIDGQPILWREVKARLNEYVIGLREKSFPVEVYDDRLSYHMQKEIDWYKIKEETGTQPPEKVYEDIDKLRGGGGA
jgi:non-homologous end joining protein Ku